MSQTGLEMTLRVVDIVEGTSVDGPGLRTSIYFGGCMHHCPGCHNASTWPLDSGEEMTVEQLMEFVERAGLPVTFSGGDPLLQIDSLIPLARDIRSRGLSIWLYTGYTFEQILASPYLSRILPLVDVIVDGQFKIDLRDTALLFRGSSNQRLIDVAHWLSTSTIRQWTPDF